MPFIDDTIAMESFLFRDGPTDLACEIVTPGPNTLGIPWWYESVTAEEFGQLLGGN